MGKCTECGQDKPVIHTISSTHGVDLICDECMRAMFSNCGCGRHR